MKSDLDALMAAQNLDALMVVGSGQHNPYMVYLTGGGHLTQAYVIKKRAAAPVLFHRSMERDEAARTGLDTFNLDKYDIMSIFRRNGGDWLATNIEVYAKALREAGAAQGRLAVFGQTDAGESFAILDGLRHELPELEIVGQTGDNLLLTAMQTKEPAEIERIRAMGRVTVDVVGEIADFLSRQQVQDEVLVKPNGQPLTVGDVKRRINLLLAERNVENPHGTIFAIGRDAGIPHSSGAAADALRLGRTIVFDIFPAEAGGGYHYDFTRTWCLGYAPDEAQALYDDVHTVYRQIRSELRAGALCGPYQDRTCALFEAQGHATIKSDPAITAGYVHSLGHGLGLHIHENPKISFSAGENDRLDPGVVVTIEPGLYYPERGMGVRLEDTVWVAPDGRIQTLVDYPMDLILPMENL